MIGGIVAFVLIIALSVMGSYNSLVSSQTEVEQAQAKIEATLQRRHDLIPNVVNSVKGYMTHEEEVFKSIADARAKIGSNASAKEKTAAQGELDSAVSRLLVLTENYPTLRSNEQVQSLIVELEGTENRIYVARTDYNAAVTKYNKSIRSFPKNIIANSFGFKEKELVNATKDAQTKVPTVDLSNK